MVKLVIPGEFTDLNTYIRRERGNLHAAANTKRGETNYVAWHTKGKADQVDYKASIRFAWYCKDRKKDPDNVVFAQKSILDGLVVAGILKGDGWKHIGALYHEFEIDKEHPRVEIEIFRFEK